MKQNKNRKKKIQATADEWPKIRLKSWSPAFDRLPIFLSLSTFFIVFLRLFQTKIESDLVLLSSSLSLSLSLYE